MTSSPSVRPAFAPGKREQRNPQPTVPIVPLLAELVGRGDGTYVLKPHAPGPDLDSWITIAQAAEIMENVHPRCLYRFLGEYLVYRRPLPRKVLVSLESILALKKATLDPEFWEDSEQKQRLRNTVSAAMAKLSGSAIRSSEETDQPSRSL